MQVHTTNYTNTLITVAEDCPVLTGTIPPAERAGKKTIAGLQYAMLCARPYQKTSDEVLFAVHAQRKAIPETERRHARKQFFSKGQACMRCSPLTKRFGWGIHFNEAGKMALIGMETPAYQQMLADDKLQKVKAMRSSRKT